MQPDVFLATGEVRWSLNDEFALGGHGSVYNHGNWESGGGFYYYF